MARRYRHPPASDPLVRRRMQGQARRDTAPEIALRRRLHAMGMRYRLDTPVVPGVRRKADLVFRKARVAVFVDGCFWHRCPEHGSVPKSNREWWAVKLAGNARRDRDTDRRLGEAGWTVVRVWEHDDPDAAAARVAAAVRGAGRVARLPERGTIVAMTYESLRSTRDHFSEVVDRVQQHHERVTVTRNGRPVAVIISPDDLAELEETLAVLRDQDVLDDLVAAEEAARVGDVVRGVEAVRKLR